MRANRSQIRTEKSPSTMVSLRNLVIGALRLEEQENIARGLRWAGRDPSRALHLQGLSPHPLTSNLSPPDGVTAFAPKWLRIPRRRYFREQRGPLRSTSGRAAP